MDLTGQLSLVTSSLTLQWNGSSSSYSEITHRILFNCCPLTFLLQLDPLEEQGMKQGVESHLREAEVGFGSAGHSHHLWMPTPPKGTPGELGASQLHGMMQLQEILLPLLHPQYKMTVNWSKFSTGHTRWVAAGALILPGGVDTLYFVTDTWCMSWSRMQWISAQALSSASVRWWGEKESKEENFHRVKDPKTAPSQVLPQPLRGFFPFQPITSPLTSHHHHAKWGSLGLLGAQAILPQWPCQGIWIEGKPWLLLQGEEQNLLWDNDILFWL